MYSYEEYVKLVHEFTNGQVKDIYVKTMLLSDDIHNYYQKTGKTPIDYTIDDAIALLTDPSQVLRTSTLYHMMISLARFNHFLSSKGIDMIDYTGNPKFTARYIYENMKCATTVPYISPEVIDHIVSLLGIDRYLNEAFIRTFYEGVAVSTDDLFTLRYSMVDHDNLTVTTPTRVIHISKKLSEAYKEVSTYQHLTVKNYMAKSGVNTVEIASPLGSLIPSTSDSSEKFRQFCKRKMMYISRETGIDITWTMLRNDGFINLLIQEFGVEWCIQFAKERRSGPSKTAAIKKLAAEFGYHQGPSNNIKKILRGYMFRLEK